MGYYRGRLLYDSSGSTNDLKQLIFDNREKLAGTRALLSAMQHKGGSWNLVTGFYRDGKVIAVIRTGAGGKSYVWHNPDLHTEPVDRSQLKTERKFLINCSVCGGTDLYRIGRLRLCSEHRSIGQVRLNWSSRQRNKRSLELSQEIEERERAYKKLDETKKFDKRSFKRRPKR